MFFSKKKNKLKEKIYLIKGNNDLIKELKEKGINNKNILDSIKNVPREFFVNKMSIQWAYQNAPLPVDCNQTISQPYVTAYMISCLKIKKTDTVLEVGTGTGYQTAIISHLCKKIYTIEIFEKLYKQAKLNLKMLKIKNVDYELGDGSNGFSKNLLFDSIIVSAAAEKVPYKLLNSLNKDGNLIIPIKYPYDNQKLVLFKKISENNFDQKELFDVKFVPLLHHKTKH
tara:strand:- start:43 stop:723 length:681 start_codon:yes stop_codon:yes gene_type:complete